MDRSFCRLRAYHRRRSIAPPIHSGRNLTGPHIANCRPAVALITSASPSRVFQLDLP